MSYLGTYVGEYVGNWWGAVATPVPTQPQVFGGFRKKKPKKLSFKEEIDARKRLRESIARLVNELDGPVSVVATPSTEAVAVVSESVTHAVPATLGRAQTLDAVLAELAAFGVQVQRVQTAQAQMRARAAVEAYLEAQRKRRRAEEWLLLLN